MCKQKNGIPVLLWEILGENFAPENILGYRYASGYSVEDESSRDFPIRDFTKDPKVHIFVVNDKKEQLVTIKKKDILQNKDSEFEKLLRWLSDKFKKGNKVKTEGIFGIIKENGKYKIEFGQVVANDVKFHRGKLIENITSILPQSFNFVGSESGCKWHWVQEKADGQINIYCDVMMSVIDNHYWTHHLEIWYDASGSLCISPSQEEELNLICRNIARLIADKYQEDMFQYVLVIAQYVNLNSMKEIGRVEFDVPLNKDETEKLRCLLFTSEYFYPDNLRWQERELYHKIEKKGEKLLEDTFGPQPLAHVGLHWAEGERDRLIWGYTTLTEDDILRMISYLKEVGDATPSRKELLRRARGSFVWKEVWTRETGHMWENYTLKKRVPSKEELDYADCSQYAVWLKDLSTETIVKLLKKYKA